MKLWVEYTSGPEESDVIAELVVDEQHVGEVRRGAQGALFSFYALRRRYDIPVRELIHLLERLEGEYAGGAGHVPTEL